MAVKLNAGDVGRIDVQTIYPEHLIYDQKHNSRSVPHTEEEIKELAASILEHSQLQPAIGRRVDGNKVQIVAGFGRCAAIAYINKHLNPKKPMKVLVRVTDMNAEEAFVKSIVENIERAETTPIDDAHAQRRLREDFGWSEAKIAEFYKKSIAHIGQLRKLLVLDTPTKAAIAAGTLPVSVAIDLTELPEAERKPTLAAATVNGTVNGEVVRRAVRQKRQTTGQNGKSLSMKEVRSYFEGKTGPAEQEHVRKLAEGMMKFIAGKLTEKEMDKMLDNLKEPKQK